MEKKQIYANPGGPSEAKLRKKQRLLWGLVATSLWHDWAAHMSDPNRNCVGMRPNKNFGERGEQQPTHSKLKVRGPSGFQLVLCRPSHPTLMRPGLRPMPRGPSASVGLQTHHTNCHITPVVFPYSRLLFSTKSDMRATWRYCWNWPTRGACCDYARTEPALAHIYGAETPTKTKKMGRM